jgi:sec-independent protein translocase protein TatA
MIELLAIFGGVGAQELLLLLLIVLIVFGAAKIPQLMRSMGTGIKEFKSGLKEGEEEAKKEVAERKAKEEAEKKAKAEASSESEKK